MQQMSGQQIDGQQIAGDQGATARHVDTRKSAKKAKKDKKCDPAPSKWAYRMHRILLTPIYRRLMRVGLPFALTLAAGTIYLSDPVRLGAINNSIAEMRHEIETRPEFMVNVMAVDGASENVAQMVRANIDTTLPQSTFHLDIKSIRQAVMALPSVAEASVRVRDGGVLQVDVVERLPVILWRTQGEVVMLDKTGVVIGPVMDPANRTGSIAGLAMIAGAGAEQNVAQARAILRAAQPLDGRLRGLVRIGARRWDVVLDRGQRIMLPEDNPVRAVERVIALSQAEDMLGRDLSVVDMRYERRPTLRMNAQAVEQWWRIREMTIGDQSR